MSLNFGLILSQKMKQELRMTPQLQQAIRLLQLSRIELIEEVQRELMENPLLEEGEEAREEQTKSDDDLYDNKAEESLFEGKADDSLYDAKTDDSLYGDESKADMDWESYFDDYQGGTDHSLNSQRLKDDSEWSGFESIQSKGESLFDHLKWQLDVSHFDQEAHAFALELLGNIDEQGYFREPSLAELAESQGVSLDLAEYVLEEIQCLDPVGIGARNLTECLLIQASFYRLDPLVETVITNYLDLLERKRYQQLAKELKVNIDKVYEISQIIRGLEPIPGRGFSNSTPRYITPDVYVDLIEGRYVVRTNDDGLPRLRINQFYRSTLRQSVDNDAKRYVTERLNAAQWLIKSLDQRKQTIIRVMESILKFQKAFFEEGVESLKPLILKQVADDLDLHESTVSRVTSNKYVETPRGLYELKYFFNSTIQSDDGDDLASEAVKSKIRKLISQEDSKRPLSDQKIANSLAQEGISIARRTVAKYRESMSIAPSSQRRQHF